MRRASFAFAVLAATLVLALGGGLPRLDAETQDLSGTWNVTGRHPSAGPYTGTAVLSRTAAGKYAIEWTLTFRNSNDPAALAGDGTITGSTLTTTSALGGAGAVDRLSGVFPVGTSLKGRYQLRTLRSGAMTLWGTWWTEGGGNSIRGSETLRRAAPADTNSLNLRMDSDGNGAIDAKDDAVEEAAPGAMVNVGDGPNDRAEARLLGELPAGGTAKIALEWQGEGKVRVYGPDGKAILDPATGRGEVAASLATKEGTQLGVAGVTPGEGFLSVKYESGALKFANRVRVSVSQEKVYLILWAYLGTEADYQPREYERLKPLFNKITGLGYKLYDDGPSFDQSKLDAAFAGDEATRYPKKLIVDRATSSADLKQYMARRSVRGVLWAGHGFMQPYPGCPEAELLKFESRVWSCNPGDPTTNEMKHFVREWMGYVAAQRKLPLNFAIMHSCTTGGLGSDYKDEAWHYCDDETLSRVKKKYGDPPPALDKLSFTTFNVMKPSVTYLQTFNGSAYFGMYDINLNEVIASIKD